MAQGYAVQDIAIDSWPDELVGWKVGLVPPQHQERLGAVRLAGCIFKKNVWDATDAPTPFRSISGGFTAVEAEFIVRLGKDAPEGKTEWTAEEAAEYVGELILGVEIAGSPLATINALGPPVVASDFGNNDGQILGPVLANWRDIAWEDMGVETVINGVSVGKGTAASIPGSPLAALEDRSVPLGDRAACCSRPWSSTTSIARRSAVLKPTCRPSSAGRDPLRRPRLLVPAPTRSPIWPGAGSWTRSGPAWGFGIAFAIWQVAHIAHAGAPRLTHFIFARMALGVGEGGGFPGGIKAWPSGSPRRSAPSPPACSTPAPISAPSSPRWWCRPSCWPSAGRWPSSSPASPAWSGCRSGCWSTAVRASTEARRRRRAGPHRAGPGRPRREDLLGQAADIKRETWAYALGKFLIDPIWWMFLFWLPDFLGKRYGLDLKTFGPPLIAIYLLSDVGSVGGGWMSSLMKMGWSLNAARKITMLICALLATPVAFAAFADKRVAGGSDHRRGHRRPPGLLGQPLHPALGRLPAFARSARSSASAA
jgi:hypothetical protein